MAFDFFKILSFEINNIPDINQQLSDAEDDLNEIWQNFQDEITAILNAASADATDAGNTDVAAQLEQGTFQHTLSIFFY